MRHIIKVNDRCTDFDCKDPDCKIKLVKVNFTVSIEELEDMIATVKANPGIGTVFPIMEPLSTKVGDTDYWVSNFTSIHITKYPTTSIGS